MKTIALRFRSEMEQATKFVELIGAVRDLANVDMKKFRSGHAAALPISEVHRAASSFAFMPIAYDGAYLAICGRFEFTVRELVERFVELIARDVPAHNHLPSAMKEWHSRGSAGIILRIKEDQFQHLTVVKLVENLASCLRPSTTNPYKLTPEAYSYNDKNFRATELEDLLAVRLGLVKVWQKLARNPTMMAWSGAQHCDTVENLCKKRLNNCMERRNAIVHRGRAYFTPGSSEVIECAEFFAALIVGIQEVMVGYKASL